MQSCWGTRPREGPGPAPEEEVLVVVAHVAAVGVTAARTRAHTGGEAGRSRLECGQWRARKGPIPTSRLVSQNLEMHDRMEHLIEKQISHSNFSTQTWATTENLGG